MHLEDYPDILTLKQLQEILGIGKNLALNLLNDGKIKAFKLGKLWRIQKKDLIDFMTNK